MPLTAVKQEFTRYDRLDRVFRENARCARHTLFALGEEQNNTYLHTKIRKNLLWVVPMDRYV